MLIQLSLGIIAIISNALSAFAGGGAGLVQLPALILLGLPFSAALATHKLASVALGIGASLRHAQERTLKPALTALILCCGLPGVWIGARIVLKIPDQSATIALGLLTFWLGIFSMNHPHLGAHDKSDEKANSRWKVGGLMIFVIGLLNGSLTSGTGLFMTIWLASWFKLSYRRAIGYTLILVGLFWNGTGALVLGLQGEIKWSWLPVLIGGSIIGGYLGSHLSLAQNNQLVKQSFELISMLMGASLIIRGLI